MNKKTVILIIFTVVVLVLLGTGFSIWNKRNNEAVSFCESDCQYHLGGWRFSTGDSISYAMTFFHTKEECVNICIDAKYFLKAFKR